jgi:hypothetical protein
MRVVFIKGVAKIIRTANSSDSAPSLFEVMVVPVKADPIGDRGY